jgi:hypothetical protein
MCGHVGVAGVIGIKQEAILKQLLVVDSLRGTDSTGIATIARHNGAVKVAKQVGDPYNLFSDKRFDQAMGGIAKAIIGHNRWATSGGVNKQGAHPFEFDTLVGAHNGTLTNKHALKNAGDFKVDSENLFHHIEEEGLHPAIKIARGAWALVWWDKVEHTMNFLRNDQRPLTMVVSKDGKGLYWASEKWMLDGVLAREGIEHEGSWQLKVDTHVSFHINDKGEIEKPVAVECKGAPLFTTPNEVKGKTSETTTHTVTSVQIASTPSTGIKQPDGSIITKIDDLSLRPDKMVGKVYADYHKNFDRNYKGRCGILFETICKARDNAGGDFVMLFDPKARDKEVRLYCHSSHSIETKIGLDIKGDVTDFVGDKNGGYYKVNPWSVREATDAESESMYEDKLTIDDLIVRKDYRSKNGANLSKEDWEKLYPKCENCEDSLDADNHNRFTSIGQVLCPDCATNPDFAQYITLVN